MIDDADIKRLKDIFVTRKECDDVTNEIKDQFADDKTERALIKQQLGTIMWIGKTTLAAVLVAIVGAVLSLILK